MEGVGGQGAQVSGGEVEIRRAPGHAGTGGLARGLQRVFVEAGQQEHVLDEPGETFGLAGDAVHRGVDVLTLGQGAHAVQIGQALDAGERSAPARDWRPRRTGSSASRTRRGRRRRTRAARACRSVPPPDAPTPFRSGQFGHTTRTGRRRRSQRPSPRYGTAGAARSAPRTTGHGQNHEQAQSRALVDPPHAVHRAVHLGHRRRHDDAAGRGGVRRRGARQTGAGDPGHRDHPPAGVALRARRR